MKNVSKKLLSNSSLLITALMGVNLLNFLFNAYLGRVLSFEEFGVITLINTLLYIAIIPCNALYVTTNHEIAYLSAQGKEKSENFFQATLKKTILYSFVVSCLWLLTIPFFDTFFKLNNYLVLLFFTPIITLSVMIAVNKGFLQGIFRFDQVGIILIVEALSKLIFAWMFIRADLSYLVYLAIPLSVALCGISTFLLTPKVATPATQAEPFPKRFFLAAVFTGLASSAFLTFDVLLVKHFLSPVEAGQYALLSLVGKMVYFLGFLPNAFMVSFISREIGKKLDPRKSFYTLFFISCVLSLSALFGLHTVGNILVPLFFGEKTIVILPYLTFYLSAITLFVLSSIVVSYHLVLKQYIFPLIAVFAAFCMCIGIIFFHENIQQVTQVIFTVSLLSALFIGILHFLESHKNLKLQKNFIYE